LRRHPSSNRLLSFDEAVAAFGLWRLAHLGRRTVTVKSIVGSEGCYADFDDEFLPLQSSSEEKWRSVYAALRRGATAGEPVEGRRLLLRPRRQPLGVRGALAGCRGARRRSGRASPSTAQGSTNLREDGMQPVQTVATRKEALPT
jgi:hypothetical protein